MTFVHHLFSRIKCLFYKKIVIVLKSQVIIKSKIAIPLHNIEGSALFHKVS